MKILYVCHRFPFPPKRGGKIRPFNMIRHLRAIARGDRRLARALSRRRRRRARARRALHPLRDGAWSAIRCRSRG